MSTYRFTKRFCTNEQTKKSGNDAAGSGLGVTGVGHPWTEHALTVRWGLVIFVYVVAKLLELADHQIYELTSHAISGHSLKHLAASFAAWPVLTTVLAAFGKTQN